MHEEHRKITDDCRNWANLIRPLIAGGRAAREVRRARFSTASQISILSLKTLARVRIVRQQNQGIGTRRACQRNAIPTESHITLHRAYTRPPLMLPQAIGKKFSDTLLRNSVNIQIMKEEIPNPTPSPRIPNGRRGGRERSGARHAAD